VKPLFERIRMMVLLLNVNPVYVCLFF